MDISTLTPEFLAGFHADLWLLSPACQPYTVLNPNAKGASDPRAQSFLHLIRHVLPQMRTVGAGPSYLLVENVAGFEVRITSGVVSSTTIYLILLKTSATRAVLCSTLQSFGYRTLELLLTPLQFGIPNSRLRYYLLAKLRPFHFQHEPSIYGQLLRSIPSQRDDQGDTVAYTEEGTCADEIRHYLDDLYDEQQHRISDKVLEKWGRLFDIVLPSARRTCCFTRSKCLTGIQHISAHSQAILGW